ncbi:TPA: hypothetical protein SMI16_003841 [Serratia liquefaciens]|nr:hypothetical protein [Serratia liquefaciens]
MDNKLSELSKPACQMGMSDGEMKNLYSQEYVSALLADNEAKDKRIAELEQDELAMRASSRAVHEAQENHINQQQDIIESLEKKNAGLGRELAAAEKRLATPVRLPNKNDDEFWFDGVFQVAKFDRAVERAISAAGFKFVGDE